LQRRFQIMGDVGRDLPQGVGCGLLPFSHVVHAGRDACQIVVARHGVDAR
jgi:hypothetical protein